MSEGKRNDSKRKMDDSPNYAIEEIGMTGDAVAADSFVAAAIGGTDDLPTGSKVRRVAMEGKAKATRSTVRAAIEKQVYIGGVRAGAKEGPSQGASEKCNLHFGHSATAAILLAGAGSSSDTFRQDAARMKELLTSESVGISEGKITEVIQRTKSTKTAIKLAIEDVIEELKNTKNGHFIFYYSGHFNKRNQFKVDDKGTESSDFYLDKDLAEALMKIPAKYMLFILDGCYVGGADVRAKVDDDGLAQGDEEAPMPSLWEFFDKSIQAKDGSAGPTLEAEKIVQWASSLPTEQAFNIKSTQSSFFTNAIIEIITDGEAGKGIRKELTPGETHVTILHLNKHVTDHVKSALEKHGKVQNPVIKPPNADEEYFKAFPAFAKML